MALIHVDYLGVSTLGPAEKDCMVFWWAEQSRVLPIWVSPETAANLRKRPVWEDEFRPDAVLALSDLLNGGEDKVVSLAISTYFQGTFYGQIEFESGRSIELRPSDLAGLLFYVEVPISVEEATLVENSVYMPISELNRTFDFMVSDGVEMVSTGTAVVEETTFQAESEAPTASDDDDFAAFMRELGVSDEDLGGPH
ncbi:bifunctional nuclease domain-containing protein [Corynebacterium epidermidicanis]|uniref:BFN domain-containing protein n=1 Tax=Corynebacterium epidermidicanis TaxID=1050174 RepID=A0A0G3GW41_9CORY|nr:bifunctional nuclease domain-containing protein [Corynebacterium epidermidicanis]AKK03087.1 hypothetical protein CEPID_06135 [Corynebacterium epidermidicanis]